MVGKPQVSTCCWHAAALLEYGEWCQPSQLLVQRHQPVLTPQRVYKFLYHADVLKAPLNIAAQHMMPRKPRVTYR